MPQPINTFLHLEDGLAELSPVSFERLRRGITAAMQTFSESVQPRPTFVHLDVSIVQAILAQKNDETADVFLVDPSTFLSDEQKAEIDEALAAFPNRLFIFGLLTQLTESETVGETTAWLQGLAARHPNAIVLAKSAISVDAGAVQAELHTQIGEFLAQRDPAPE